VQYPKMNYIRSRKLMSAYRQIPCQICGVNDGTVVGAHSNQSKHGKGRGIKASDIYCASLCHKCHHTIDQGTFYNEDEKRDLWNIAHAATVNELLRHDLYPKGIKYESIE